MSDQMATSGAESKMSSKQAALVVDHPQVIKLDYELSCVNGKWQYILIIVTDVPLNPKADGHDSAVIDDMVTAVVTAARSGQIGYDTLTLRNP